MALSGQKKNGKSSLNRTFMELKCEYMTSFLLSSLS